MVPRDWIATDLHNLIENNHRFAFISEFFSESGIMTNHSPLLNPQLLAKVREFLNQSRKQVFTPVNTTTVQTYWQIGCLIVEDQQGEARD